MNDKQDKSFYPTDVPSAGTASEPAVRYNSLLQVKEHLRYQGVETLMKIDDVGLLRILIPEIQKMYMFASQTDSTSLNSRRLLESLDVIGKYEDNWDGEDSPAIIPAIIDFTRNTIRDTNDYLLEHWSIFPSSNGTLKMEIHQPGVNAGINIGCDEFSYYIHNGSDEAYGKTSNTRKHILYILTHVYYGE